jgi:hypothetical protein
MRLHGGRIEFADNLLVMPFDTASHTATMATLGSDAASIKEAAA